MPLGKNSIKRAANNGYSNVKTNAPDMENSEVLEVKTQEKTAPKKAAKKATPVKAVAKTVASEVVSETKKAETKPAKAPAAKKTPAKKTVKTTETADGFKRVSFGEEMPYYLL